MKITILIISILLLLISTNALTTTASTPEDLVNALISSNPDFVISNIHYTGHANSKGLFSGADVLLGIQSGILLSTGLFSTINESPSTNFISNCMNTPGDSQLSLIAGVNTLDASILEFDFELTASYGTASLTFNYFFASEEYNEYANQGVNDAFGLFVNGINCALLPGTTIPISINTVNAGNPVGINPHNPLFYRNNVPPTYPFIFDGFTVKLSCEAPVNPGVNHIKLAIADGGDCIFDSAVFIEASSFVLVKPILTVTAPPDITLDCITSTLPEITGFPIYSTLCPNTVASYSDSIENHCGATKTITRTWTVTDDCGNTVVVHQIINVVDITPPTVTFPSEYCLWPPNHKYYCFLNLTDSLVSNSHDNCENLNSFIPSISAKFVGCISNQPDNGRGDGNTSDDCVYNAAIDSLCVRAERSPNFGTGSRIYMVTIEVSDLCENVVSKILTISVPHSDSSHPDCLTANASKKL